MPNYIKHNGKPKAGNAGEAKEKDDASKQNEEKRYQRKRREISLRLHPSNPDALNRLQ